MARSLPSSFGSALLLLGAFSIGWVLHQTLTLGEISFTSPIALGVVITGGVLVVIGYRLERRFDPAEFIPNQTEGDEGDYDESASPLQEEWLDGYERDESFDR